jgi:anti-sigma B factor antagonist
VVIRVQTHRLDAAVSGDFRSAVKARVRPNRNVVLDLTAVELVDSTGLGSIVSLMKEVGPHGQVRLCGVRGPVASLLKVTRLDKLLITYGTAEDALAG